MEKKFTRVQSINDIFISISFVIIGLLLAFLPNSEDIRLGGYTFIALGIVAALILKSAYKDTATGKKYLRKEFLFSHDIKSSILHAIKSNSSSLPFSEKDKGQGLRLEIYYSKASPKAYVQLFEYIPHQYQPCSEMYEYEMHQIEKWLK